MPTTATHTYTVQKLEPFTDTQDARTRAVKFKASAQNLARGTVMGQVTSTGLWAAYDGTAIDGTETARGILVYDLQISASSLVTYSGTALQAGDEFGVTFTDAPIYIAGVFRTSDLTGLDASAVEDLGGHLESGSLADGVLRF